MSRKFILHDYFRSTASFRVRMALEYKNIPYELREVHLVNDGGQQHSASYRTKNPQGLVPLLEYEEGRLSQSLPIIEYLDALYPQPPLLSSTPELRAQQISVCCIIACDTHPLNNLRVLQYLESELSITQQQKQAWYFKWIKDSFEVIEKILEKNSSKHAFSDEFSIVDIFIVAQVYNAVRYQFPLDNYPCIAELYRNSCSLSFINSVHPDSYS